MPRLRQAVIAAADLDAAVMRLREELELGEPYADPAVAYFGLRNAVFAIGDRFLEIVSPVKEDTAAGRLIERRGGDCGYMAMFQVDDVAEARKRAASLGVREVLDVEFDDITEAHLHPVDMTGAIVSVSQPEPAESWRWGGPGWRERSAPGAITGLTVAVADPEPVRERWGEVVGDECGVTFVADEASPGIIEIHVEQHGRAITVTPT